MLFFKYSVNRYGLGLSNELLFIIIAQGVAKFEVQENCLMLALLLSKKGFDRARTRIFLRPPILKGHSFAGP